jgi:tetratricopeptide (TPR) repeat protein
MRRLANMLALALLCSQAVVFAAGGGGGGGGEGVSKEADDPVVVAARAAIAKQDWAGAQAGLKQALADNPKNANYHNLYAYSMRKAPNPDMDLVFKHYQEALRLDPRHRGAHEYIGEAYLQVGDLARARQHLAALDRLCFFPCEEYSDLKKAVASYEAGHKVEVSQKP